MTDSIAFLVLILAPVVRSVSVPSNRLALLVGAVGAAAVDIVFLRLLDLGL